MLARRSRLQVKPNIALGSKSGSKPPAEKVVEPANVPPSSTAPAESPSIADLAASLDSPTAAENAANEARDSGNSFAFFFCQGLAPRHMVRHRQIQVCKCQAFPSNIGFTVSGQCSEKAVPIKPTAVPPEEPEVVYIDPLAPEKRVAQ